VSARVSTAAELGPTVELLTGVADATDSAEIERIARESGTPIDTRAELGRAWARLWVARLAGSVAGFCLVWDVADEVHVQDLATDPPRRRQGVARALLASLVEHARCRSARLVLLEVRRTNEAALALYRTHGFRIVGERRGYYRDTGEDAILMSLESTAIPDSGTTRSRSKGAR
jgi:[ribosomal protein S18]-alanine N-acetyltransferase